MNRGVLWLDQVTKCRRLGVKGPRAADLLTRLELPVPASANSWSALPAQATDDSRGVVARLGNTEFFLEEPGEAPTLRRLESVLSASPAGAWPVLHEDAAFVLGGSRATEALAEVCNVNFAALDAASQPVVMTLMAGVGVLVLPQTITHGTGTQTLYRIWCDPSFGSYLWETLATVLNETTARTTTGSSA